MLDLPSVHCELRAAIDELEGLTAQQHCPQAAMAALRYRLMLLSRARRKLVRALCTRLQEEATSDTAVLALIALAPASRRLSSTHLSTWTLRRVAADWQGYCRASAIMRAAMRRQIDAEAAALYPHLRLPPIAGPSLPHGD